MGENESEVGPEGGRPEGGIIGYRTFNSDQTEVQYSPACSPVKLSVNMGSCHIGTRGLFGNQNELAYITVVTLGADLLYTHATSWANFYNH